MRRGAPARGLALTAALALSLTACTGGEEKEPEETASPSTTAPASASQGTGSERPGSEGSESDGAEKSEGTDESTEPSDDQPSDAESPQADGGDSDPSGADGGEYVPASADGPAKNVPKPEMPEEMKEETPEVAKLRCSTGGRPSTTCSGPVTRSRCSRCPRTTAIIAPGTQSS